MLCVMNEGPEWGFSEWARTQVTFSLLSWTAGFYEYVLFVNWRIFL